MHLYIHYFYKYKNYSKALPCGAICHGTRIFSLWVYIFSLSLWGLAAYTRPPLNKKLFPVHRPGGLNRVDWDFFFFMIFEQSFFFSQSSWYILVNEKLKTERNFFSTSRLAFLAVTRRIGNDFSLKVGLSTTQTPITFVNPLVCWSCTSCWQTDCLSLGHPLTKYCFRSSGRVCILLHFAPPKKMLVKISSFSYQKKKGGKKEDLGPPDWPQFRPPAGQETNFFLRVALVITEAIRKRSLFLVRAAEFSFSVYMVPTHLFFRTFPGILHDHFSIFHEHLCVQIIIYDILRKQ